MNPGRARIGAPMAPGLLVLLASCASTDLGQVGSPDALAAALGRSTAIAARPANRDGRPIAYLALGGTRGARLAAFDLGQSRLLWLVPAPMTGRVVAGSSIVVHAAGRTLVAREVATGAERWRSDIPSGEELVGYAVDGDTVTFVARRGRELRGGEAELVALGAGSGGVSWRRSLGTSNVGGPAARGGIVAVPNRSQFVSLFDERTGEALGQALAKEQAADFVEASPEGFFYGYGSDGAYLLSPATAVGVRSSPGYLHANFPAFVRPVYHLDMYRPELIDYGAIDRNRVLWRGRAQGPGAAFADGQVCVLNYRFFFGFDAVSGTLRWAYDNPVVEAASAAHQGASILFATTDGELGALDPRTGQRTYRFRLPGDEVIVGATFDAEGTAPRGGGLEVSNRPLAQTLISIVWDPDRRFSEAQIFAVDQLAHTPGREVTAELLKILGADSVPAAVVKRAGRALVDRKDRDGVDLVVQSIRTLASDTEQPRAVPLDVLARIAGAWRARDAGGPLAAHLRFPETEPATVVDIVHALVEMRAVDTLPALRDYLMLYRADPEWQGDPSALLAITDALVKMGGRADRELLLYLAEEPRTLPSVRAYAGHALAESASGTSEGAPDGGTAPAHGRSGAWAPGERVFAAWDLRGEGK